MSSRIINYLFGLVRKIISSRIINNHFNSLDKDAYHVDLLTHSVNAKNFLLSHFRHRLNNIESRTCT